MRHVPEERERRLYLFEYLVRGDISPFVFCDHFFRSAEEVKRIFYPVGVFYVERVLSVFEMACAAAVEEAFEAASQSASAIFLPDVCVVYVFAPVLKKAKREILRICPQVYAAFSLNLRRKFRSS